MLDGVEPWRWRASVEARVVMALQLQAMAVLASKQSATD